MFSKYQRINSKDILLVIKQGKRVNLGSFSVSYLPPPASTESMFAVVVSKKIAKTAVQRNLIRRRFFAFLRENKDILPKPFQYAFFVFDKDFKANQEVKNLLIKLAEKI